MTSDIEAEAARLKKITDEQGNVNIFLSEGAGAPGTIAEIEAAGVEAQCDLPGHVKPDTINPGQWSTKQLASKIEAEKVMVQKSGHFSHSLRANADDLRFIKSMTDLAAEYALRGESGVVGYDEENGDRLRVIPFPRITGGKPFDIMQKWFTETTVETGQDVKPATK